MILAGSAVYLPAIFMASQPSRPFERYRTRSALFLMIYAVTALLFGIPNILMLTRDNDGFLILLITSILVVVRFIGYIKLAGFALLEADHIKKHSGNITMTIWLLILILLFNAGFLLYRFGLNSISVVAVSFGSIGTSGVLISHMLSARGRALSRSQIMKMVTGVLIVLGCANICIKTLSVISPLIGLMTLFFGIYTEKKFLSLALRQTFAVAAGSLGSGIVIYFTRYYLEPGAVSVTQVTPPVAIMIGVSMSILGVGYYIWSRRQYIPEASIS